MSIQTKSKPRRTRLIAEVRIELILDKALDLFASQNYASVTTRDIAATCGVNVALIYYYFKNKDGLFRAVIKHAIDQAYRAYRSRTRNLHDPVQALLEWFQVNLDQFVQLKKMAQVWVAYNSSGQESAEIDTLIKEIYAREQRLLFSCIKAGVASGKFRAVDPRRTATFISNHLDGICFVSMTRRNTDVKPLMTLAQDVILRYLLAPGQA